MPIFQGVDEDIKPDAQQDVDDDHGLTGPPVMERKTQKLHVGQEALTLWICLHHPQQDLEPEGPKCPDDQHDPDITYLGLLECALGAEKIDVILVTVISHN